MIKLLPIVIGLLLLTTPYDASLSNSNKGKSKTSKKVAQIKRNLKKRLNAITDKLASQDKFGKSFACCKKLNIPYHKCVEDKKGVKCFSPQEKVELLCQKRINKTCNVGQITKQVTKKGAKGKKADPTQLIGGTLQHCLKTKETELTPVCTKNLKDKLVGMKKRAAMKKKKSTNRSRDQKLNKKQ